MAIVGILLAVGVPSYRYVTTANRISGEVNGLVADMQYARAEAIKEGQTVSVCASSNGTTCSGATAWANGWIVFPGTGQPASASTVLHVQGQFYRSDTFNAADGATSAVQFNREGFALGLPGGVTFLLHDPTGSSNYTRCLQVSVVGALSTVTYNGTTCT